MGDYYTWNVLRKHTQDRRGRAVAAIALVCQISKDLSKSLPPPAERRVRSSSGPVIDSYSGESFLVRGSQGTMHAAAIKHIAPKAWNDDCKFYERDISNHAKLYGRGAVI